MVEGKPKAFIEAFIRRGDRHVRKLEAFNPNPSKLCHIRRSNRKF